MSRGFPSMTAILGLLAITGYQNRDKIAEMLSGVTKGAGGQGNVGNLLDQLRGSLAGTSAGGILSGGLRELVDRFTESGQGDTAESWVKTGPNKPIEPSQLERAIGPEVLDTLTRQTGLSRQELLARLTRDLPHAVDDYAPEGRLPTEADFSQSDLASVQPSPGIQAKEPPADIREKQNMSKTERALEQALDDSMDASDPPAVTQPGKNFIGPND